MWRKFGHCAPGSKLKDATLQVQTTVSQAIESNIPLVEKALSSTDRRAAAPHTKADYSVGLQTLGVPDAERVALNEKVHANGYGLDTGHVVLSGRGTTVVVRASFNGLLLLEFNAVDRSGTSAGHEVTHRPGVRGSERRRAWRRPGAQDVTLYVHYVES